jgi:hypothetical protein
MSNSTTLEAWRSNRERKSHATVKRLQRAGIALEYTDDCIDSETTARIGLVLACPKPSCGGKHHTRTGLHEGCGEQSNCFEVGLQLVCERCGTPWVFALSTNECGHTELTATFDGGAV